MEYTLGIKKDSIVESVKKQFDERSAKGQETYGTTLEENDKDDFLQHLKEELQDATLYIEKLQSNKERTYLDMWKSARLEASKEIDKEIDFDGWTKLWNSYLSAFCMAEIMNELN